MRYYLIVIGLAGILGCNSPSEKREEKKIAHPVSRLDAGGTDRLEEVLASYFGLKNALVKTDAAGADKFAAEVRNKTDSLQAWLQHDSAVLGSVQLQLDTLKSASAAIIAENDPGCEKKRIHFEKISDHLYALLRKLDLQQAGIYREYCPMAFNDKGAYWLSEEVEIKNPYFGSKMLECGEVTDSL